MSTQRWLNNLVLRDHRVVFVDECYFTNLTLLTHAYALKGSNIQVESKQLKSGNLSLLAAVSMQFGLEAYLLFNNRIDSTMFLQLVPEIKSKFGGNFALFMDNASYHKSEIVRKCLLEANVPAIYNLVATPVLNPIEQYFGVLK